MAGFDWLQSEQVDAPVIAAPASMTGHDHEIRGTVTVDGAPARRRVAVYRRETLALHGTTQPATDGAYRFPYMNPARGPFIVLALDWTDDRGTGHNAAVSDQVMPVPMEE